MLQQILAIFLVLGLLVGTLALLRRRGFAQFTTGLPRVANRQKQMHVLERISLGPQHSLVLVDVKESVFLIGVSPSGCNRIATLAGSGSLAELQERAG